MTADAEFTNLKLYSIQRLETACYPSTTMSEIVHQLTTEIERIDHILDSVPFMAGSELKCHFLNTYRLIYADLKQKNLTEESWEQSGQIPANKLLKLAISFGNLIEAFKKEKHDAEIRNARMKSSKQTNTTDPFDDDFTPVKLNTVAPPYLNLAKNLLLILRNFDIGTAPPRALLRHLSNLSVCTKGSDVSITEGEASNTPVLELRRSPIRLNSRQMLIEKLEINIRIDALFTMKIALNLTVELLLTLRELRKVQESGDNTFTPPKLFTSASSMFSATSISSESPITDDYDQSVKSILGRLNSGLVGPFTSFLHKQIVEPHVIGGFQNLLDTM